MPVTSAFSHAKHAARGKEACTTCHVELLDPTDAVPAHPTAASCATCHDGKRAFAVTATCTKCHRDPATGKYSVARPATRFLHATHQRTNLPCAACHKLAPNGELITSGHEPCAGCHADDFGKLEPKYCGACHNGTEPWRHLVADRLPADTTEFGATLDHKDHPGACESCHRLRTASQALRPPRGHAACTTAGCHAVTGGPAPRLDACESCHAFGRFAARLAARTEAPWSVRTAFDHGLHTRAKDDTPLPCTQCHDQLAGDTSTLRTPGKPSCAPCHDGTTSFKLTGTTCNRCHQAKR
jgi:c(7)-type cytochrome triheme protein